MTARIKTIFSALILILLAVFLSSYNLSQTAIQASDTCHEGDGWIKPEADWTDPLKKEQVFDAGVGFVVDQVCIKGGETLENFTFDTTKSCWQVIGINTQIATAKETWSEDDDKGSDCKDISHVSFHVSPCCLTPSPSATPSPEPTPPTDSPTPTSTSTPTYPPCTTKTPTPTITNTPTNTPTATSTPTTTNTPTNTPTGTLSPSPTPTDTPTNTPVPTQTSKPSDNNDNNDNGVGGDESPAPTTILAESIIQSQPTVLGSIDTTNYLLDAIKDAYGGQILGVNSLPATASDNISGNLPSSNQLIDNHFISIPSLSILEPVYQSQTLADQLLVGDNQIIFAQINGANVYYGHNQYGLFSSLYQLQKGKSVFIDDGSGLKQFTIISKANVNFSDLSVFDQANSTDIFLITCSRTYPDTRIVIKAQLI